MKHLPVLLEPINELVKEISIKDGVFVDGTFGRGGHTQSILKVRPDLKVIALDCDDEAIQYAKEHFAELIEVKRLIVAKSNFTRIASVVAELNTENLPIAGILLDLGVSSPQLDEGRRGFSFYHDGPLDMRMDQSRDFTAADIVNTWPEDDLNDLFKKYGEITRPYRVTQKIIEHRREKKFSSTFDLSDLIARTEGWRKKGFHPATQYFMALRIEVNQELRVIEEVIPQAIQLLSTGGRLLVITFHSLEDRILKTAFKKWADEGKVHLVNKKVIQAEWAEKKSNPRARSAKLRVLEKLNETKG